MKVFSYIFSSKFYHCNIPLDMCVIPYVLHPMDAFVWSILMVCLSSIYLDENRVYCTVLLTQLSIRDRDTFVYDIEITIAIDQLFLRKGWHLSYCQFSAI